MNILSNFLELINVENFLKGILVSYCLNGIIICDSSNLQHFFKFNSHWHLVNLIRLLHLDLLFSKIGSQKIIQSNKTKKLQDSGWVCHTSWLHCYSQYLVWFAISMVNVWICWFSLLYLCWSHSFYFQWSTQ